MAAFNGIRVLPDIPKNIPNMENLIQEFETGFGSSSRQNLRLVSELSTSSGGSSFVKKIVEAYESSVRASIENAEQEHARKRSGLFNTIRNQKNVEKSDSSPSIYDELGSSFRRWTNLKTTSEIPSAFPVINKHALEDDFVTPNRCRSKIEKKTDILKPWSGISSKINKYGFMRELTNIRPSSSKSDNLKTRDQIFYDSPGSEGEYKLTNNMSLICSSPLEDEDTYYNEDPLDDILTNSRDSSNPSNSSYKNLQGDLYNFENERWQFELSTSSPSLNSSSRSLCNGTSSTKNHHANDSLLLGSSFQDITVIPLKDGPNDRETPQATERILKSSSDFNRDSPRVIGVSLKRPIKIDDDTSVTWIPVLDEKLPQKKSLKKLLSMFHPSKLSLNYRKIGKRLRKKQSKREHIFDSGFIERCPSLSSSSSQKSWHSDVGHVEDEPSTPPTFGTFGRPKCVSERCTERTVRDSVMLTELLDARKLTSDFAPFDPNPWISPTSLERRGRRNVESSSSVASFSKSRIFCSHPSLPKHPHLIRSSIPKHPFVAKTKMDQIEEEEATAERTMRCGEKIEQPDVLKPRCPSMPIPVPQSALNVSHPKMSDYVDLSTINNYDLPK